MTFEEKLSTYADLIVQHGMNVQKGQLVFISAEAMHRDLAVLVAERSYARGAKHVTLDLIDARMERLRLEHSSDEDLTYTPGYWPEKYREMVDEHSASCRILGQQDPDILKGMDPKRINSMSIARRKAIRYFYDEGITKSKVHWTIAAAATPAWGKRIYPELDAEAACEALWEDIFSICRADSPDCLQRWKEHNTRLQQRASALDAMGIEELHFTGPETDLRVRLSPKARFKGGTDTGARGAEYEPNLPTEEVFTTPDWRGTTGHVRATRPFLINGKLIKGLKMRFEGGELVDYSADEGVEHFKAYVETDAGAKRLGEVALVGIDSPIYQTGRIYEEILFDENAACHIAVGQAYKFCLDAGADMSKEELDAIGCNESHVHTDMMISSEEVDVFARTRTGEEQLLIKSGEWVL